MGQRLGIAAALLGDPAVPILDEPMNGLDLEGILRVRRLLRSLATVDGPQEISVQGLESRDERPVGW